MDEIAKAFLAKLALLEHINDAMGYLFNEINHVGSLADISYEEDRSDSMYWTVFGRRIGQSHQSQCYHPI